MGLTWKILINFWQETKFCDFDGKHTFLRFWWKTWFCYFDGKALFCILVRKHACFWFVVFVVKLDFIILVEKTQFCYFGWKQFYGFSNKIQIVWFWQNIWFHVLWVFTCLSNFFAEPYISMSYGLTILSLWAKVNHKLNEISKTSQNTKTKSTFFLLLCRLSLQNHINVVHQTLVQPSGLSETK